MESITVLVFVQETFALTGNIVKKFGITFMSVYTSHLNSAAPEPVPDGQKVPPPKFAAAKSQAPPGSSPPEILRDAFVKDTDFIGWNVSEGSALRARYNTTDREVPFHAEVMLTQPQNCLIPTHVTRILP